MPKVPIDYTSIFIGQLDRSTSEDDVRERFSKYGTVVGVQVLVKATIVGRRPSDGGVTGFAFVKYENREAATKAVKAEVPTPDLTFPKDWDLTDASVPLFSFLSCSEIFLYWMFDGQRLMLEWSGISWPYNSRSIQRIASKTSSTCLSSRSNRIGSETRSPANSWFFLSSSTALSTTTAPNAVSKQYPCNAWSIERDRRTWI